MDRELMTAREVAAALNVSANTLRAWRYRKIKLPYLRQGHRVWYRKADIEAYRARNYVNVEVDQ